MRQIENQYLIIDWPLCIRRGRSRSPIFTHNDTLTGSQAVGLDDHGHVLAIADETFGAAGVEIVTDIDKTPFINAMGPVYDKYVTSDKLKSLVKRIQETK